MSLRLWMPLMGDLRNQGLDNFSMSTLGTISWVDGKLGAKALQAGTSSQTSNGVSINSNLTDILDDEYSVSVWIKPLGNHVHYNGTILSSGDWNHTCWAFGVSQDNTKVDVLSNRYNVYLNCTIPVNEWTHLICTCDSSNKVHLYKNGEYIGYTTRSDKPLSDANNATIGRETYANGYFSFNGAIQDLRLYDHCLSSMEVKQLSQGLVLHYPLSDNSIQQLNNCYTNPTFNSSSAGAGWSHWGSSGHKGTYGQNTDSNYIYREGQSYSHWVADGADATKNYLVYQSPAFEGGQRSLQCICKEENSLPIDESIVFPDWNARNGGTITGKWTSIISLGNGFYHCKCENIQQDGSNDLIGFYIRPGYKVYFSEAYVENDRECCSDIFYSTNVIYDTSGFCNNGSSVGTFTISSDTPKYSVSSVYTGSNYIYLNSPPTETQTIAVWAKWNTIPSGQSVILVDNGSGIGLGLMSTGILCSTSKAGNSYTFSKANLVANTWYHFVIVKTGTTTRKLYINGVEQTATSNVSNWTYSVNQLQLGKRSTTSDGFAGKLCDFRAYATALSTDDVKSLYQNCATIDPDGTIRGQIRS